MGVVVLVPGPGALVVVPAAVASVDVLVVFVVVPVLVVFADAADFVKSLENVLSHWTGSEGYGKSG